MEQDAKGIRYQSEHFATVQGIMHHVNEQSLMEEHRRQGGKKATGIDGVDKAEYDRNAEENIRDLIERMKLSFGYYTPKMGRCQYIRKSIKGRTLFSYQVMEAWACIPNRDML